MKVYEVLYNYLINYIKDESLLYKFAESYELDRVLFSKYNIDDEVLNRTTAKIKFQKFINDIIFNEMLNINEICSKIKVLFLKGILLSYDLYKYPEIRKTSDIDILVTCDDLPVLLDHLGKLGYKDEKGLHVSDNLINVYDLKLRGHNHLPSMNKQLIIGNMLVNVPIEVHLKFTCNWDDENEFIKQLINKAEQYKVKGKIFYRLDVNNNFLYLLYHFSKDFILDYYSMLTEGKEPYLRLLLLIDILLFENKYRNKIVWEEILKNAEKLNIVGEVLFALKLISEIFPKGMYQKYIVELQNVYHNSLHNVKEGFRKKVIKELLKYNASKLIFSNKADIIKTAIFKLREGIFLICPYKIRKSCENILFYNLKCCLLNTETYERNEIILNGENISIGVSWDYSFFIIVIKLPSSELEHWYKKDMEIILSFYNYQILKMIDIKIKDVSGEKRIIEGEYNVNQDKILENILDKVQITKNDDSFLLQLKIPWNVILINPKQGNRFLFDIQVNGKVDKNIDKINYLGCWFLAINDPTTMAEVILVK